MNGSIKASNPNPTIFHLDSHKKLINISKKDHYRSGEFVFSYTYSENQITETYGEGFVYRKFYFENNNLTKVVSEMCDLEGFICYKYEILFQEFDNNPNPFKNMYFVKGAFYRAFSENNYKSITINEYTQTSEGTFYSTRNGPYSTPIQYNTDGYPMFGDYE